jgi:hypothetical protein
VIERRNRAVEIDIDPTTVTPHCFGDPLDLLGPAAGTLI